MGLGKSMTYSTVVGLGKDNIEENRFVEIMKEITSKLKIFDY